jgi:thiamine kinase-like enzyme
LDSAYESRRADRDQVERWFKEIEWVFAIYMALGIVHNNLNPSNIMFHGNFLIIIDFDSSRPTGHDLSLVKRTHG